MSLNMNSVDQLLHAGSLDLLTDNRKGPVKERSHSESPQRGANLNMNIDPSDVHTLSSADIYSWKLKKGTDGVIFAVYCIHVALKSGMKWLVEKRYTQFRELRKEIKRIWPDLAQLEFPKKRWMFNLSRSALKERQAVLNAYLSQLMDIRPQPLEVAIFLEVEINVGGLQLAGTTLSQRRAASGVDSIEALMALRRRTLSFTAPGAPGGLGEVGGEVSLQDFHLIKVLGKGSFGKVFLVRPVSAPHEQVFAMKVLRKVDVIKRHQVEHTLTERSILANTPHPFILALRYAFQSEHKLYMVTDYCPGGELFFHLKKLRRFTEGMMRFYSAEIALALSHLHIHSVVYRDLKPENVLLDKNGHIKLTDFGLSKRVTSFALGTMEASTATFCGTPEYLSPEMIVHRRSGTGYSKEVDWWALGIVCFELLTGWPPFYDRDFTKMCEKILYKPLVFPVKKYNITKEAEDVIKGLLQRDFTRRMHFEPLPVAAPASSNGSSSPAPTSSASSSKSKAAANAVKYNLRSHAFYADMDWAALMKKQVIPPFVPPMGRDITDTRNFEKEFTKLTVKDSPPASVSEAAPSVMNNKEKSSTTATSGGNTPKKSGSKANSKKASDASAGTGGSSTAEGTAGAGDEAASPEKEPDVFAGFSFNGYSAFAAASAHNNANNSGVLSAPPSPTPSSPSPVKGRSSGGASSSSTPLLRPVSSSPSRSSRDKSVDKSLPNLGLFSSNGRLSSVRSSESNA